MADLNGEFLQRAGDDRKSDKKESMAIALNDLVRDRIWRETAFFTDISLHFRRDLSEGPNSSGDLPHTDFLRSPLQPGQIALHLLVPESQLEAKSNGLCVNSVSASNHRKFLVFQRLSAEHLDKLLDILNKQGRRLFELQSHCSIHHIGGGHPDMDKARVIAQ